MFNIHFNGYLECSDTETFQIAFQQFLKSTKGKFYGNLIPEKLPDYIDYQKIEENDNERHLSSNIQSEDNDNKGK